MAVEGALRTVVDKEEGAVRHGMKTSCKLYVVRQARTTKFLWSTACDASIEPVVFKDGLLFKESRMFIVTPEGVSTCGSTGHWQSQWKGRVTFLAQGFAGQQQNHEGDGRTLNQDRARRLPFTWRQGKSSGSCRN